MPQIGMNYQTCMQIVGRKAVEMHRCFACYKLRGSAGVQVNHGFTRANQPLVHHPECPHRETPVGHEVANPFVSLRRRFIAMTPDERLLLIEALTDGYCRHCGDAERDGRCYCMADD